MELPFGSSEISKGENASAAGDIETEAAGKEVPPGEIDILVHNVCVCFSVGCSLNLKHVARTAFNVEHQIGTNVLLMRFRKPRCTARIFSSGKVTLVGASTEEEAKIGARRCARVIQKLGFKVRFTNYRIVNVLATCTLPFAVRIGEFSVAHQKLCSYEPMLHPACTLKFDDWKASLQIYYIGKMSILAPCVANIQLAVEKAYELLLEFKKERRREDILRLQQQELSKLRQNQKSGRKNKRRRSQPGEWPMFDEDFEEELEDSCEDDNDNEHEDIPSTDTTDTESEGSDTGNENVELRSVTNQKKVQKKRKTINNNKKAKRGASSDDDGDEGTEDDDDDEEYVPQKKKIKRGLTSTPLSSPKQGYSLRKSVRKSCT